MSMMVRDWRRRKIDTEQVNPEGLRPKFGPKLGRARVRVTILAFQHLSAPQGHKP